MSFGVNFRNAPKKKLLTTRSSVVSSMFRELANAWGAGEFDFHTYKDRPADFIEEILGDSLKPKQREICAEVEAGDFIAVTSARGIGKTWLAARLAIWWLCTRPKSVVITTAPIWFQVRNLLWRQIREAHNSSRTKLPGEVLQTEWTITPTWYALGLSVDDPIRFQGHHAEGGVFYIADEASGVHDEIHDSAMGFFTEGRGKCLLVGNPNQKLGLMWRVFDPLDKTTDHWRKMQVSAFDCPELIAPGWIEKVKLACGVDYEQHPIYQVQVLGQFPDEDDQGLFPVSLLIKSEVYEPSERGRHLGIDVAREGGDLCVAVLLVNGKVSGLHSWRKSTVTATAAMTKRLAKKWKVPGENIHVDVVGIGGGVVDILRDEGYRCDAVDFGLTGKGLGGEYDHLLGELTKVKNRRAELHWACRRLLEEGELSIPSKYHPIRADMTQLWYDYDGRGYLMLPEKKLIKKKIGRSPDFSDALMLALSRPKRSKVKVGRKRTKGKGGRRSRPGRVRQQRRAA